MVKSDYITRQVHPDDRRKTNLNVTDSGKEVIIKVQNIVEKNRKTALNGITKDELEVMYSALLKISENCLNPKK